MQICRCASASPICGGRRAGTPMVLRQLEYLVALAREKHFGRAALACNVSQPTLSAAIRQLEENLGAPIVERGHKFHGLTAQGRIAVDHAHRILAEADMLRRGL